MLFKHIIAAIGFFGTVANVEAQLTNSTLLGILNTTQLSPATKFISFLQSDPKYKRFLDLLDSPGNRTVFVPSDRAFDEYIQGNSTYTESEFLNNLNATASSTSSGDGGDNQEQQGQQSIHMNFRVLQQEQNNSTSNGTNSTTPTTGSGTNSTSFNPFIVGPLSNYTVENILQYHVVNGSWLLKSLNDSSVLHSQLTNKTVDKTGTGLPVLITSYNLTVDGNNTQYDNQAFSIPYSPDEESQESTNTTSKNVTAYHAGNGVDFSNVTLYDIKASNGVLHFIDRVLVPPGKPSQVIQNVTNATSVAQALEQNQTHISQIDNLTNVTYLVPSNEALNSSNTGGGNNNNNNNSSNSIQELLSILVDSMNEATLKNYILQGVYYLDNLTTIAQEQGHNSVKSAGGTNLTVSASNGTMVKFNDTATIVQPNILTNNGVIHIIDQLLSSENSQSNNTSQNSTSQS